MEKKKYNFPWGEVVILFSFALPMRSYKYMPESYWWVVVIASALLFFLGLYITLHKLPPRSCWGRAMWALGLLSAAITFLPLILYWIGVAETFSEPLPIMLGAIPLWVLTALCVWKYRRVRGRSMAQVEQIRMQSRRKRVY